MDQHFIDVIRRLYSVKRYNVEMNGECSATHEQQTGIRQGCPLSPYLFLCIMTVLFSDIKKEKELSDELIKHRINEVLYDEILYDEHTSRTNTSRPHTPTRLFFGCGGDWLPLEYYRYDRTAGVPSALARLLPAMG